MRHLSSLISVLIILLIAGNLWWQTQLSQPRLTHPQDQGVVPCEFPMRWRLAEIDPLFQLSRAQAHAAVEAAALAWNQKLDTQVFVEDAQHGFPIYFRYDERQQQLLANQRVQRNVERYDSYLQQQHADLQMLDADYQQQRAEFERLQQALTAQMATKNASSSQIVQGQAALRLQADLVNALVQKIQDKQQHYQQSLQQREQLLTDAPHSASLAEVGLLVRRASGLEMQIFAYRDQDILVRTLTHEFGHALGIDHLPSPSAIMHETLNNAQTELTAADLTAAKASCAHAL